MSTILESALSGLPIIFLNGTVLSFNGTVGYGSQQESTLNIDLIEDCDQIVNGCSTSQYIETDQFIGSPQYFTAGDFTFGGVISSWNKTQNTSGKIFNIKMVDPRQLLENVILIVDSIRSPLEPYLELPNATFWTTVPVVGLNYCNVYAFWEDGLCITTDNPEQKLQVDRCCTFGRSLATEQGMPYRRIVQALLTINPTIYSMPHNYPFKVDFTTFPINLPEYYRIPGPSITILQLLQDVCDVLGYDFYVYLEKVPNDDPTKPDDNVIKIGLVNLKNPPNSFSTIFDKFNGIGTDLSFGEEIRNDITRSMMIGEQVHKLTYVDRFLPYFGQDVDTVTTLLRPVVPFYFDVNGFWIAKNVNDLNVKLFKPFFLENALYSIHELDIRCAMASFKAWLLRTMANDTPGTFNFSIRSQFSECVINNPTWIKDRIANAAQLGILQSSLRKNIQDLFQNPTSYRAASNRPDLLKDLETIHQWLADLGATYYGKQYLVPLTDRICAKKINYNIEDLNYEGALVYSHEPTNAGGWVEPNVPVLDLPNPELEIFKTDDGRVKCFAVFKTDGEVANAGVD